jgi:hypothetical protein
MPTCSVVCELAAGVRKTIPARIEHALAAFLKTKRFRVRALRRLEDTGCTTPGSRLDESNVEEADMWGYSFLVYSI